MEKSQNDIAFEKLKAEKFKDEPQSAWRFAPTTGSTIKIFSALAIVYLGIGIALMVMSGSLIEKSVRYDQNCYPASGNWMDYSVRDIFPRGGPFQDPTTMNWCSDHRNVIEIPDDLRVDQPLYIHYQLNNFYQNYLRYAQSRDLDQLNGTVVTVGPTSKCSPVGHVKDLHFHQRFKYSTLNTTLFRNFNGTGNETELPTPDFADTDIATPCGLIAKSLFNDTYQIIYSENKADFQDKAKIKELEKNPILIDSSNLAWQYDTDNNFHNTPGDWQDKQWWDQTDQHFMVWMRTANLADFKKLYGQITGVKKGFYMIQVNNQFNVQHLEGEKHIFMSTTNALGGQNYFLAIAFLTVGVFSVFSVILFTVVHFKNQKNGNGYIHQD